MLIHQLIACNNIVYIWEGNSRWVHSMEWSGKNTFRNLQTHLFWLIMPVTWSYEEPCGTPFPQGVWYLTYFQNNSKEANAGSQCNAQIFIFSAYFYIFLCLGKLWCLVFLFFFFFWRKKKKEQKSPVLPVSLHGANPPILPLCAQAPESCQEQSKDGGWRKFSVINPAFKRL